MVSFLTKKNCCSPDLAHTVGPLLLVQTWPNSGLFGLLLAGMWPWYGLLVAQLWQTGADRQSAIIQIWNNVVIWVSTV